MLALALVTLLGQTRYLFELDSVPVGTVTLQLEGRKYTYTSTHAYRRTKAERSDEFTIGPPRPTPEGFWLWHKMDVGCVPGVAELSNEVGELCAEEVGVHEVKGTTLKKKFVARYDAAGELEELTLGKSRFVRTTAALVPGRPYAKGFTVVGKGKHLELDPPFEGLRWPANAPKGTRTTPVPDEDSCLELAGMYVDDHPGTRVALGVVMEKGRAYPHAWVVAEDGSELDPSAKVSKPKAANKAYLELPRESAGQLYLDLLEGRRLLMWK